MVGLTLMVSPSSEAHSVLSVVQHLQVIASKTLYPFLSLSFLFKNIYLFGCTGS